jgi:glycine cleavage system regulatory protein
MPTSLVVTVIGEDKPGLVEALSSTVAAHDGNWLESRMSHMAGKFAGIVRVEVPEASLDALVEALGGLDSAGLRVIAEPSPGGTAPASGAFTLDLVGADQPGIVSEIARALSARGVNVEELATECTSAPMSGDPLFKATAVLRLPAGTSIDDLRRDLEELASSLMVDLSLAEQTGVGK